MSAAAGAVPLPSKATKSAGTFRRALRRFLRHRLGCVGLIFLMLLVMIAILAPLLAPYDPTEAFYDVALSPPSWSHLFGTDDIGRDVLSRAIYGARVSLEVIAVSIFGAIAVGSALGMVAGYAGGWFDTVVMRIMDGMLAFPMIVLALAIVSVLGPDLINAIIAITIVNVPGFARLVRGQVLSARQFDFVQAARCLGASDLRIMTRHIWPVVVGNVIVYSSLRASAALITETSLAFLGLGEQPPTPSWGSMLTTAMQNSDAWWLSLAPGLAIFLAVQALNFMGDGLRDVLDVKLND